MTEPLSFFFVCRTDKAFLFVRRDDKIYAWTKTYAQKRVSSELFGRRGVLVLYDPPEVNTKGGGGADFRLGNRQLILAMSANEGHNLKAAEKATGDVRRYVGPPSEDELCVMVSRMETKDSLETILEWARKLGRLLRYVISESRFLVRSTMLDSALSEIKKDEQKLLDFVRTTEFDTPSNALPGTILTVAGQHKTVEGDEIAIDRDAMEADDAFEDDAMEVGDANEDEDDNDRVCIDYEGAHINYRERVVRALNDDVMAAMLRSNRETILSYWGVIDPAEFAGMGMKVEELFLHDLCSSGSLTMRRKKLGGNGPSDDKLSLSGGRDMFDLSDQDEDQNFEGLRHVLSSDHLVSIFKTGFPVIDAAGPGMRVYSVTVGSDHSKKMKGMVRILECAGFLKKEANGILKKRYGNTIAHQLEFYWVVPPSRYSTWGVKKPKTSSITGNTKKDRANKTVLKDCFEKCVVQYALEIPYH